jgi:predicted nucleic acid-binding protein
MIVVADTSPLNYLILIGEVERLPSLYRKILIPQAVHKELLRAQTPLTVRNWAASLPAWCEERSVTGPPDLGLDDLDLGEREAIQLAA